MPVFEKSELKYLELLSNEYPTVQSCCTEIINLNAIMNLPKGTEHFLSDIHGENEAFCHILNNGSGVIKEKVDTLFKNTVDKKSRTELLTLIYYPENKLKEIKAEKEELFEWYRITLYRLVEICKFCASKYTRSKVRKALPKDFEYIIDELLNNGYNEKDKENYYKNIIETIISIDRADAFIYAISGVIKRLVVDSLHIVGDIFDRGPHADIILDRLLTHHAVDIQWGNHDVLWMGAGLGCPASIACVLNISTKYDNIDFVENAYGINLRPLALFAEKAYSHEKGLMKRMHTAIAIMQFKLEGQTVKRNPEFRMNDRSLLDRIDYEKMSITIEEKEYKLNPEDFITVDKADPCALSAEEREVMDMLVYSFTQSEKLRRHIEFLFSHGSMYKVCNGNLLLHGCVPMNDKGEFLSFDTGLKKPSMLSGKDYLDYADKMARKAYFASDDSPEKIKCLDYLWYLWCGRNSPLFGRDRITTFERMFIPDKSTWTEDKNAYYKFTESREYCEKVLREFSLDRNYSHIINGHVPVHSKDGEMPVKGDGKLIVIDGGFCKAYQNITGIAGYTLFFNSYGIRLVSHEPFSGLEDAIHNNRDIISTFVVYDSSEHRISVAETDIGAKLRTSVSDLERLLLAYRTGHISEKTVKPKK